MVTLLPEYLRFLGQYYLILYGLAVLGCMLFMPEGIAGLLLGTQRWLGRRWGAANRGRERQGG